jgi:hypothetical protein
MARLKPEPISQSDLVEYLDTSSDFAFELKVLNLLAARNFDCEHSGTYIDNVTSKPRQFDIRAKHIAQESAIQLAVECKNLKYNAPLLVTCVPRTREESFHDVIVSIDHFVTSLIPDKIRRSLSDRAVEPRSKSVRLREQASLYKANTPVGKSIDQVGREVSGVISAADADVYSKWAQALASAAELADRACEGLATKAHSRFHCLVIPILVVPDDMLWEVRFDSRGKRVALPKQTDHVPLFAKRTYTCRTGDQITEFCASHLEIVTARGLQRLLSDFTAQMPRLRGHVDNILKRYLCGDEEHKGPIK